MEEDGAARARSREGTFSSLRGDGCWDGENTAGILDASTAVDFFVAVVLFALAGILIAGARHRLEGILLAVFLFLVGFNFLSFGLGAWDYHWFQVAFLALALDPFFLLAFVSLYPYHRRSPMIVALLLVVGALGLLSASLVIARPALFDPNGLPAEGRLRRNLAFLPLIGGLALSYAAAWLLAVRAAVHSPSPLLARRGAWMAAAVGVAVIPRLGLVYADFGITDRGAMGIWLELLVAFVMLGAGWWVSREALPAAPHWRRALVLVTIVSILLPAIHGFAVFSTSISRNVNVWPFAYGLRWVAFGAILAGSLLSYEIVELRRASDWAVPALLSATGSFGVALVVLITMGGRVASSGGWPFVWGLAAIPPLWILGRSLVRRWTPASAAESVRRRLELYRTAFEAAWATGLPDDGVRRRLDHDRKRFQVSVEEARALEHVVSTQGDGSSPPLAVGSEPVPGLVLDAIIGEGAQGRVYAGRRFPTNQRVAVKEFQSTGTESGDARRQWMSEVRALERIRHPGVARLLDYHLVEGRHLLVLEYVDGVPLSESLAEPLMPEARIQSVFGDLLEALGAVHAKGVLHRDIKPSNVLIQADGKPRLTDFGIAAVRWGSNPVEATMTSMEPAGTGAGTLAYMAPEQVRGDRLGPWTDVYALGLTLYEALTGRPALDVLGMRPLDAMGRVARPTIDFGPVPRRWLPFVKKALQPMPARRFKSAASMRQALLRIRVARAPGDAQRQPHRRTK